ncbi:hypothetical protein HHK36_005556 [Tetracentron sinense]|uniref:Gnk2-homologous domain-containing protein n=1 Tax=Tetracentron sinense TaxID=13715 RepID=A0A834ZPM6_TETSI|nr:hypothetical protein HHK36_005556 [Tetracentron sinense]
MFRFSNRSIFATMEDTPFGFLKNPNNYSDPVQFKQIRGDLLERLVTKALSDSSTGMFATRETNFSGNLKIYGMVQCTPDISLSDCNICLRGSVAEIPHCCEGKKGARVLKPSCNIRYESFPFMEQKATAPASPPLKNTTISDPQVNIVLGSHVWDEDPLLTWTDEEDLRISSHTSEYEDPLKSLEI